MVDKLGEIKYGKEIGKARSAKFIYTICPVCKKERWVYLYQYQKSNGVNNELLCSTCNGHKHGVNNSKFWGKLK
jgi:hypothetical protein